MTAERFMFRVFVETDIVHHNRHNQHLWAFQAASRHHTPAVSYSAPVHPNCGHTRA